MSDRQQGCKEDYCTCTSDEAWSCLTSQWNKHERPKEEAIEKKQTYKFKKAIEKGDIELAQKLLPKIKFKW